jgi:hypothetical protein
MKTEISLPCSQESFTGTYPDLDPVHTISSYLSKIHFSTIHAPMSWSSE